jgi:hypothetical protein
MRAIAIARLDDKSILTGRLQVFVDDQPISRIASIQTKTGDINSQPAADFRREWPQEKQGQKQQNPSC